MSFRPAKNEEEREGEEKRREGEEREKRSVKGRKEGDVEGGKITSHRRSAGREEA